MASPRDGLYVDHPRHAEAVGDHAEARGKEGLGQRHLHLPAVAQRREQPLGLGLAGHREREREALAARPPFAPTVGDQHRGLADTEARMHDLALGTRRDHGGVGAVLEAHEHRHLGAERAPVELDRLLAAALEEQVGLDLHRAWHRHDSFWSGVVCPSHSLALGSGLVHRLPLPSSRSGRPKSTACCPGSARFVTGRQSRRYCGANARKNSALRRFRQGSVAMAEGSGTPWRVRYGFKSPREPESLYRPPALRPYGPSQLCPASARAARPREGGHDTDDATQGRPTVHGASTRDIAAVSPNHTVGSGWPNSPQRLAAATPCDTWREGAARALQPRRAARRTRPGRAPVCRPWSSTTWPATMTWCTPSAPCTRRGAPAGPSLETSSSFTPMRARSKTMRSAASPSRTRPRS